jgi:murein DD-endopeptidase MepM/ murein hydrolase activator NlpD
MGFVMQYAVSTSEQARLLRPVSPQQTIAQSTRSAEKNLLSAVTRRKLLRSAKLQGMRTYVVADAAPFHSAAPEESSSSSEASVGIHLVEEPAPVSSVSAPLMSASSSSAVAPSDFPPFIRTQFPISKIPNWGAMHTAAEWNRTYAQMTPGDFVSIPPYSMKTLTTPMDTFTQDSSPDAIAAITEKLFYSTRFFGAYDLDSGEFTAVHPAVDLKLALGTPLGAIAGGRVLAVVTDDSLGLHAMIEHHIDGDIYISIYGHMSDATVKAGDTVIPGQIVGHVGMTGNTAAPHVHLQIDRGDGSTVHTPYWPASIPSPAEAAKFVVNPVTFIQQHASGQ